MKPRVAALMSMLTLALWSCTPQAEVPVKQIDIEAEKAAVVGVVGQLWESWETENLELFSRIVAHDPDMVNFGSDAAERWVGWEAFRESIAKQLDAFESFEVSAGKQVVKVHESGTVAWFSEVLDVKVVVASGEAVELAGTRFTGVLEKRDGNWVIVQIHASVPVAGQAAEY